MELFRLESTSSSPSSLFVISGSEMVTVFRLGLKLRKKVTSEEERLPTRKRSSGSKAYSSSSCSCWCTLTAVSASSKTSKSLSFSSSS